MTDMTDAELREARTALADLVEDALDGVADLDIQGVSVGFADAVLEIADHGRLLLMLGL